jgi:hypothetical protein
MPDQHDSGLFFLLRRLHLGTPIPVASANEPTDEELIRLIEGSLSQEQKRALEERLLACPYSADRVAIVREALKEAGVTPPPVLYLVEQTRKT